MSRFRFVDVGVAAALLSAGWVSIGIVRSVGASGSATASSFVPITPCRLADTRGAAPVGSRVTPIGPTETVSFQVTGTNGGCTIPATATGIASNVTAVSPTGSSYLTVYPADVDQPLASNLNWTATSPPTPNQVTVQLSSAGAIKAFNNAGTIDVVIDIVGYYIAENPGPANVIWVAKSGGDFTTVASALASITDLTQKYLIKIAPGTYDEPGGIDMKSGVDIEGSGEGVTFIQSHVTTVLPGADSFSGESSTVRFSADAELRSLTVHSIVTANTSDTWSASAIYITGTRAERVTHVSVLVTGTASGGAFLRTGGIAVVNGSPLLKSVTVTNTTPGAATIGIYHNGPGFEGVDLIVAATGGALVNTAIYNVAGDILIRNSRLLGATAFSTGLGASVRVANSEVDGAVGSGTCLGSWKTAALVPLSATCD